MMVDRLEIEDGHWVVYRYTERGKCLLIKTKKRDDALKLISFNG